MEPEKKDLRKRSASSDFHPSGKKSPSKDRSRKKGKKRISYIPKTRFKLAGGRGKSFLNFMAGRPRRRI